MRAGLQLRIVGNASQILSRLRTVPAAPRHSGYSQDLRAHKRRTERVLAHARKRRLRPRPSISDLDDDEEAESIEARELQYGILTQEMLDQEPPGHRAGAALNCFC